MPDNGTSLQTPTGQLDRRTMLLALNSVFGDRLGLARALGQTAYGGQRDYNTVLGYPQNLTTNHYLQRYDRQDIAGRVVDLPAEDTWQKGITLSEDGDAETEFVQAWNKLNKRLGARSKMMRADRVSGIGRYGVLYIGLRDGASPEQPVNTGEISGEQDVIFLRPFSEASAEIATMEKDSQSERFGLPAMYKLSIESSQKLNVHWSRVLHLADNKLDSDVYGIPRLQRIFNRLDDLMKLVGGTAEATWLNMRPGTILTTQQGFDFGSDDDAKLQIQNEIEEYLHGVARIMTLEGVDAIQLQGQIMDASGPFDVCIALISAASGIPQRVLLGSAAGELSAAEEDTKQWYGTIASRQVNYAEPDILRPFIDRLMEYGALPEADYDVYWPPLFQMSDKEKAELANERATAVKALADPLTMELPITEDEIRDVLGFPMLGGQSIVSQTVVANYRRGSIDDTRYRDWLVGELESL